MKTSRSFSILFCMIGMFLISACEKAETHLNTEKSLQARGVCEECPSTQYEGCCCAVFLQPFQTLAEISLCGSTDGVDNCSGDPQTSNCESFSGGGKSFTLTDEMPRMPFCMEQGTAFWIANIGNSIAHVIITCQNELSNPDTTWLHIPVATRLYFTPNSNCVIGPCE